MQCDVVGRVDPRNRVLDGRVHQGHLATTFERLCAAAMRGSATIRVATRPVPKLLWAVLFSSVIVAQQYAFRVANYLK